MAAHAVFRLGGDGEPGHSTTRERSTAELMRRGRVGVVAATATGAGRAGDVAGAPRRARAGLRLRVRTPENPVLPWFLGCQQETRDRSTAGDGDLRRSARTPGRGRRRFPSTALSTCRKRVRRAAIAVRSMAQEPRHEYFFSGQR